MVQLPEEPEAPPELPALDNDPLARCATDSECHVVDVCGSHVVMSRLQQLRRAAEHGRPCAFYADNREPIPAPACVERVCATIEERTLRAEIRAAQRALGPAHAAWQRVVSKVLATRAAQNEIETAVENDADP